MLSKEVKQGEIIHKIFDVGDVKDMSYTDKDSGEVIKRLSFTITSNRRDRDRDIVEPSGAMTDNYAQNPVMLWAHKYDEVPIARSVEMSRIKEAKSDGSVAHKIQAITEFQPDSNYQKNWTGVTGGMIYEMYRSKFLNAVSIGFDPHSWEPLELKDGESSDYDEMSGTRFLKWDMLEFSGVPVPSNPDALVDRKSYKKMLKTWANETIKMCDGDCPMNIDTKSITTTDKNDLLTALGKENLTDLSAYHRRLHQWASQSNLLTGFTQSDMNWLHARVEAEMCDRHKSEKPPTKCADPSPLEWKKEIGDDIELKDDDMKCAHVDAVVGAIRDRENAKPKGVEGGKDMETETKEIEALTKRIEELEATIKAGKVLSAANESDLRDAVAAHNSGVKLTNGVLDQVTGKPAAGPTPDTPAAAPETEDAPVPKPAPKDVEPVETKEEAPVDEPIVAEQEFHETFLVDEEMLKEVLQSYEGTGNAQSGPITSETED